LETGRLALASAGHESPLRLVRGAAITAVEVAGGPPLCVMDDFPYQSEMAQLAPGDGLCLFTDGATDARNPAGQMLGRDGWFAALAGLDSITEVETALGSLQQQLAQFISDAELADDVTLMLLRWQPR